MKKIVALILTVILLGLTVSCSQTGSTVEKSASKKTEISAKNKRDILKSLAEVF